MDCEGRVSVAGQGGWKGFDPHWNSFASLGGLAVMNHGAGVMNHGAGEGTFLIKV